MEIINHLSPMDLSLEEECPISIIYKKKTDDISDFPEISDDRPFIRLQDIFRDYGFISNEKWTNSHRVQAKVVKWDSYSVSCDCLMDKDSLKFETRVFNRELFGHLKNLSDNTYVLININSKPGAMRIDIYNGDGVVEKKLFDWKSKLDKFEGLGLGKTIDWEE